MSRSPLRRALAAVRWRLRNRFYLTYGFRGTAPINPGYGSDLGTTIDRYYERRFLEAGGHLITGDVLEIGDRKSTDRFGRDVTSVTVMNPVDGPGVDVVGDLTGCPHMPDEAFDCILLTQVIHVIYDMEAVVAECHRMLKPGGCVVCTTEGIAQVNRGAMEEYGDRWRLTSLSAAELFATAFPEDAIEVTTYGNALAACCFVQGIPAERVRPARLDIHEPDYEITICVVARKEGGSAGR